MRHISKHAVFVEGYGGKLTFAMIDCQGGNRIVQLVEVKDAYVCQVCGIIWRVEWPS